MSTIVVYGYDRLTGAYTGPVTATESPLEPGVYMDPAFTLRKEPPAFVAGTVPIVDGDDWVLAPDHRGEVWYTTEGAPVQIDVPGDPAKSGLSKNPPAQIEGPPTVMSVSPRQLRLWLLGRGLLDRVDTAIGGLPEADRSAVQIEWEYATVYERDNPFVVKLGAALKMTPEEIDAGFREAAQL